ncbi:MAG TPA: phosphatase PAP2 family protein [Solirubrobacteraceae bacterium]|nr:phosphatase PAP2 family protein [Solirubrobacteraceae bacterium]
MSIDEQILRAARTRGHDAALERRVAAFSRLGEHGAVWLAIGGVGTALDARRRRCWRKGLTTVGVTYALNTAVKLAVRRPRPALDGLPPLVGTPTGLGFPSAHTATAFAAARCYTRCGLAPEPLYALALALALSRLYLGVHYPSDLLAGALLGAAVAALA